MASGICLGRAQWAPLSSLAPQAFGQAQEAIRENDSGHEKHPLPPPSAFQWEEEERVNPYSETSWRPGLLGWGLIPSPVSQLNGQT